MNDKKDKCGGNCGHYVSEHDVHYSFGRRGEMADGDRHYSILTKDGKEIKIDDTVANGQYFPGFMGFDYMPYRDLYTGEVSYFSSNDKIKTMTFDPEKGVTEKELCSEEYDLETDSTVYKTDGKEVSESEYYNYKSTLSRFIPLEVENTELTLQRLTLISFWKCITSITALS